jgi:uncharacterized cupredoxin-like copper-binding protein
MRRRIPILAAASAIAVLGTASSVAAAPTKVRVVATEYRFAPAPKTVKPGATVIQLVNQGDEFHDIRLRKLNAAGRPTGPAVMVGPVRPGKTAQKTVTLKAGKYSLVCTIGDHAEKGMVSRITVRK